MDVLGLGGSLSFDGHWRAFAMGNDQFVFGLYDGEGPISRETIAPILSGLLYRLRFQLCKGYLLVEPFPYQRIRKKVREEFSGRPVKQAAMRAIMNARMAKGASVREHMLKMISHFNEAKILGANIDAQNQVDMVLETLLDSFNQLKLNYNMGNLNMTIPELMKDSKQHRPS
ncbi:hypothetical protein CRG98_020626 [Punica granatum]|uniref:Uncharacterized protein n=1 Tax=Punica granatum TaxID=22663 RepID=A0A2I0JRX2_PUNGR|nr:hypothetical protein CRG98_020626 [Punica granatum]